jgi:hypothetical protein
MKMVLELNARVIDSEAIESPPCCPSCNRTMNLHQPDENLPSQLLATCGFCGAWYSLIELKDDPMEVLMIELPRRSVLEEQVEKTRTKP